MNDNVGDKNNNTPLQQTERSHVNIFLAGEINK